MRNQTLRRVNRQFGCVQVRALTSNAYFCGMARNWDNQWQGNGVLLLSKEVLYFRLWGKNLDLSIPLNRVESAEIIHKRRPFLGPHKLLKVVYRSADDRLRTATWRAEKPHDWARMIQETLKETIVNGEQTSKKHIS